MPESDSGSGLPRRGVLRALALAPVALAGCAAGRAGPAPAAPGAPGDPGPAPAAQAAPALPAGALAALRTFRLPADAEPAFVFRAVAARPGEPR
jgi:hypothetical protein